MPMTPDAKRALSKTIRSLRKRLLKDLHDATESTYRLSLKARDATLSAADRTCRARLETHIAEQLRGLYKLQKKDEPAARERFRREVEKDAAATLLNRLVYLRLLEAAECQQSGRRTPLRKERVVTGGYRSRGYQDFCEHAPELVQNDPSAGYAYLLQLIFDDLAQELPGLFGPVRLTGLIPIPPATLRAVVDALDVEELASCWTDDMTLGWVYQYWNDPEREALDEKLNDGKKLEPHEIASKTQMFTERYMVEWLLHNSLGQQWLALCKKHGWTPEVQQRGVFDRLDQRRADWRAQREAGAVALDELMPIEGELEQRWKYWVPQPLPDSAVDAAPDSLRDVKLLDPACGSGHFLVVALPLLFALYQEEARHRGCADDPAYSDRAIVEHILEHNLHGIDLDPRAVQIAAAGLLLKARQLAADCQPRRLHLVASQLRLSGLPADDPALQQLCATLEHEVALPAELTRDLIKALAGADHLGTLLQVGTAITSALQRNASQLSAPGTPQQGDLFLGHPTERRTPLSAEAARDTILQRLETFLAHHSRSDDLGLRLHGEQLKSGLRLVRMLNDDQYDLVIGNPPYLGTNKLASSADYKKLYPQATSDHFAGFFLRALQLCKQGSYCGLITLSNWMFLKAFADFRNEILHYHLSVLADFGKAAFTTGGTLISTSATIMQKAEPATSVAQRTFHDYELRRDDLQPRRTEAALQCQVGRFEFDVTQLKVIPEHPVVYWWEETFLAWYQSCEKFGEKFEVRQGLCTGDNARFLRSPWEVSPRKLLTEARPPDLGGSGSWLPFMKGGEGRAWIEPLCLVVRWWHCGLEIKVGHEAGLLAARPQNEQYYLRKGVAVQTTGTAFAARRHHYASIFGDKARTVFTDDVDAVVSTLNSTKTRIAVSALNPTIDFTVGDLQRIPWKPPSRANDIGRRLNEAFAAHEASREVSVEIKRPGPSYWRCIQDWAQRAVDRTEGEPLPPYDPEYDPEPPTDHLSFAIGIALGRFDADGEGILAQAPGSALPTGILFLSAASEQDSLSHPAATPILSAWADYGAAIQAGEKKQLDLRSYLQHRFFGDVHRKMYENRPIYFPLSSEKRNFVAHVSIHRWNVNTLRALLAEHLHPALTRLQGELADLQASREGADKATVRDADKRHGEATKLQAELQSFIQTVEQCAEQGPPPPEAKTPARERDARYDPDLDDGVMINSAALWPLLKWQWKDPEKWWQELAKASGKKDYDWAHLAARYFPSRVLEKCKKDPSLAVAHGCFWKLHPELAYKWELRLQDEIAPDFTLDEPARREHDAFTPNWIQESSGSYRATFEVDQPEFVTKLKAEEKKRRKKKAKKAKGSDQIDPAEDDEEEQTQLALQESSP